MDSDTKRRKSSILKPQKNRNPLGDVDLGNEDADDQTTNITKTVRRVSFASNNSVKPFVADPEKNTIWDLTYEEAIEKSDSSQLATCSQLNQDKENVGDILNVTSIAGDADDELDLTPTVNQLNFNNYGVMAIEQNFDADMEFTTGIGPVLNSAPNKSGISCDTDMEFTTGINHMWNSAPNKPGNNFDADMEFTTGIGHNILNSAPNNSCRYNDDMEYTTPIHNFIYTKAADTDNFNVTMEETEMIPVAINFNTRDVSILSENIISQPESLCANTLSMTCADDTQQLINYNLSIKKKSDFSKVISGESVSSFPDLLKMPLRGINSTSFVQDCMKELRTFTGNGIDENKHENCAEQLDGDMEFTCIEDSNVVPEIVIHEASNAEMEEENEKISNNATGNIGKDLSSNKSLCSLRSNVNKIVNEKTSNSDAEKLMKDLSLNRKSCSRTGAVSDIVNENAVCETEKIVEADLFTNKISCDLRGSVADIERYIHNIDSTAERHSQVENTDKRDEAVENCREASRNSNINQIEVANLTQQEDDSIVELCTRVSERRTSFLGNISDIPILESSDTSLYCNADSDVPEKTKPSFKDRLVPIDFTVMENLLKASSGLESKRKQFTKKLSKFISKCNAVFTTELEEFRRKEQLAGELQSAMKNCRTQSEDIVKEKCCSDIVEVSSSANASELVLTSWKDKILKLFEGSDGYWKIVSLESVPYTFTTLFETIELYTSLDNVTGQVLDIAVKSRISRTSERIALYMHKIFMEKLTLHCLQAALGKKFNILSLLDYVKITMADLLKIDEDFTHLSTTYAVCMDEDYRITFGIVSVQLVFSWRFTIDASDSDSINGESVTYRAKVGKLRERDIRKCMEECPKGFFFIKAFISNLYKYVEQLETK